MRRSIHTRELSEGQVGSLTLWRFFSQSAGQHFSLSANGGTAEKQNSNGRLLDHQAVSL